MTIPGKEAKKLKEKIVPLMKVESEKFDPDLHIVSMSRSTWMNIVPLEYDILGRLYFFELK